MAIGGGAWTYTGDPASSATAKVRFLSGDIDTTDQLLSDEEIAWLLTVWPDPFIAAAQALEAIVASGRLVDKKIGDLEIKASTRATSLLALAKNLRTRAGRGGLPYAGGLSISDKKVYRDDTDIPTPAFEEGQFDHPTADLAGDGGFHANDDGLT
jgi:hypothetical protein